MTAAIKEDCRALCEADQQCAQFTIRIGNIVGRIGCYLCYDGSVSNQNAGTTFSGATYIFEASEPEPLPHRA